MSLNLWFCQSSIIHYYQSIALFWSAHLHSHYRENVQYDNATSWIWPGFTPLMHKNTVKCFEIFLWMKGVTVLMCKNFMYVDTKCDPKYKWYCRWAWCWYVILKWNLVRERWRQRRYCCNQARLIWF